MNTNTETDATPEAVATATLHALRNRTARLQDEIACTLARMEKEPTLPISDAALAEAHNAAHLLNRADRALRQALGLGF